VTAWRSAARTSSGKTTSLEIALGLLAERPLAILSPGERLRAALICLTRQAPAPELLVLDEPTQHLDFVGLAALEAVLAAWPGGLLVVSHDPEFLAAIGVSRTLDLPLA
jgi:ATPase subunit of ABC transporter with duplicated ATPase domains